ncbi:MAG: phosphate ABC transporter substrate-binding protein PstS [Calditrichales bacterium]|nr:MAG: phosphate ABC transporter substrate-binding protein PstS [Calditrichales bacterium]
MVSVIMMIFISCGGRETDSKNILVQGAGATFPYPVYAQWAFKYEHTSGIKLNYQSIGSGGGIAQIKAKTVDFGASDAPLEPAELAEAGLLQFPMVVGGVVPVINLNGVEAGSLRLTSALLSDIFLGKIVRWNDPKIAAVNAGVTLPDLDITVVHRADGSGTTWIFTNYLQKVSEEWKTKVGFGKAVDWPVGMGGKGNEGVAAFVQRVEGSIGYVEYAYALQNQMNAIQLQNKNGNFVKSTIESFQAAAANADWKNADGFYMILTDQPGDNTWPITGASFILVYKEHPANANIKYVLDFFDWSYKHGAAMAEKLHYVPIPENVVAVVENVWKQEIRMNNASVWQ